MQRLFVDRTAAGEELAEVVYTAFRQKTADSGIEFVPIVYALPRGGLPVAEPVARRLHCPLTVVAAKKISHPDNPELAIGAVTASAEILWSGQKSCAWDLQRRKVALQQALSKAQNQAELFAPVCPRVDVEGAIAILVDDGIATGMTIAVAAKALKAMQFAEVWLCTPVAPLTLIPWLQTWGDRVVALETPQTFFSVSNFYWEFPQVETAEALSCLQHTNANS